MSAREFTTESLRKLESSGLTEDYAREMGVRPVREPGDLPPEFAAMGGWATVPGMLFPWRDPRDPERVTWQYRPDQPGTKPDGEPAPKYLFAPGQHQKLGLVKDGSGDLTVIVEGTLQGLAVARYAADGATVLAIPGCEAWLDEGNPPPALAMVAGRDVVVILDADAATNANVYRGGERLMRAAYSYGARAVFFAQIPVGGKSGVDDWLASVLEDQRAACVERALSHPSMLLRDKPSATKPRPKPQRGPMGDDPSGDLPASNDTALGTTWADDHLGEYRYLTDAESWLRYRDGRWSQVAPSVVGSSLMRFMDEFAKPFQAAAHHAEDADARRELQRAVQVLLSSGKRAAVRTAASEYDLAQVRRDQLDQHPTLLCLANCVIDLETWEVRAHDPELLLTAGTDVAFDPDATCPRFDQFLAEVLPDVSTRAFTMRVFAMALLGEVREHILPVLIGEGRNGKGTLLRILLAVLGIYGHVIKPTVLLARKYEDHDQEIAQLAGKRLVVAEETGKGAQWNVARVNEWTGGGQLNGRFMRGNSFTFKPSHTLVMATNHRPNVGDGERAFWARYREIPFTVSFEGREDLTLEPHILRFELPGVLNRLLEAGREYRRIGLAEPAAVIAATAQAKLEGDSLALFCAEHIQVTNDHARDRISNKDMYNRLIRWWRECAITTPPPSIQGTFGKEMRHALEMAPDAKNPRKLGDGTGSAALTWTGVRWADSLTPLGNEVGNEVGNGATPSVSNSNPAAPANQDHIAELGGVIADPLPTEVDHSGTEDAGQGSSIADIADIAEFGRLIEPIAGPHTQNHAVRGGTSVQGVDRRSGSAMSTTSTTSVAADATPCPSCGKSIPEAKRARHASRCGRNASAS